ncbi:MAG: methionyl-tRNA formyltransferase [Firmicutes bacterium]|nr:methionyl-tRNA formyltransferase [Bacillota bacterium]
MRILFMGTPQFALNSLRRLLDAGENVVGIVTQPDRPRGRGKIITPPPVKAFAQERDLVVYQPQTLRDLTVLKQLRDLGPELIVVVAYGKILPREILNLPPHGCINIHASLLPRYRGAAPIQWALLKGEEVTGVTSMYMSEGLDEGDIILQSEVAILPTDTMGSLHDKLACTGAELLLETVAKIKSGTAPRIPQPEKGVSFAPPLDRSHQLINWGNPAPHIWYQVRALNPRPGATTYWQGSVLKVWDVAPRVENGEKHDLGEVVAVDKEEGILVQTGKDLLQLKVLQPAGRRKMSASDFARGYGIREGVILGK